MSSKSAVEQPTVSVLVAVYNAETTLERCLDSLLTQTYRQIEVLCVDDCSTDNSADLLRQYADRDSRIRVFRQKQNMGQAVGRNLALRHATGTFVTFLDSDDWMSADAIELAVGTFEQHPQTDCVLFDFLKVTPSGQTTLYPMSAFDVMDGYTAFVKSLTWQIHGVYMTRTDLHKQYPYDETCHSYSDDNTTRQHYFRSREVRCCKGRYFYFQNERSVTHAPSIGRLDYMRANESMKWQLKEMGVGDEVLNIYEEVRWRVVVDSYLLYFVNKNRWSSAERLYALDEIRRVRRTIERWRVPRRLKYKFGYMFMPCWWLFCAQEWAYFSLRSLLGRNVM